MQTMPVFVYLIPALLFFGLGSPSAVIATVIYAVVPVIRLTSLGIRQVDREVVEAAASFGSTRMQALFKVQIPQALPTIMTGVNQTLMMAMAMVVTCSMIGRTRPRRGGSQRRQPHRDGARHHFRRIGG